MQCIGHIDQVNVVLGIDCKLKWHAFYHIKGYCGNTKELLLFYDVVIDCPYQESPHR